MTLVYIGHSWEKDMGLGELTAYFHHENYVVLADEIFDLPNANLRKRIKLNL